jgi:hypothetical protein
MEQRPLIIPLETREDVPDGLVGGKALGLMRLRRAGFGVPPGFVLTTEAFLALTGTTPELAEALAAWRAPLEAVDGRSADQLEALIETAALPEQVRAALRAGVDRLTPPDGGDGFLLAVRSSGLIEDSPLHSFAGINETFLSILPGEALELAVRRCWASTFSARARAYLRERCLSGRRVLPAVVVQVLVPVEKAGVVFTAHPVTGDTRSLVLDACFGLGEQVVSGRVQPDHFVVRRDNLRLESFHRGDSAAPPGEPPADGRVLTEAELRQVAAAALAVERALGGEPVDIEWGLLDGQLYFFQARPITALPFLGVVENGATEAARQAARCLSPFVEMLFSGLFSPLALDLCRRGLMSRLGTEEQYLQSAAPDRLRLCPEALIRRSEALLPGLGALAVQDIARGKDERALTLSSRLGILRLELTPLASGARLPESMDETMVSAVESLQAPSAGLPLQECCRQALAVVRGILDFLGEVGAEVLPRTAVLVNLFLRLHLRWVPEAARHPAAFLWGAALPEDSLLDDLYAAARSSGAKQVSTGALGEILERWGSLIPGVDPACRTWAEEPALPETLLKLPDHLRGDRNLSLKRRLFQEELAEYRRVSEAALHGPTRGLRRHLHRRVAGKAQASLGALWAARFRLELALGTLRTALRGVVGTSSWSLEALLALNTAQLIELLAAGMRTGRLTEPTEPPGPVSPSQPRGPRLPADGTSCHILRGASLCDRECAAPLGLLDPRWGAEEFRRHWVGNGEAVTENTLLTAPYLSAGWSPLLWWVEGLVLGDLVPYGSLPAQASMLGLAWLTGLGESVSAFPEGQLFHLDGRQQTLAHFPERDLVFRD